MSTLKVNNLEPISGNSITINSELLIKGPGGDIIVGGTGSSNITASFAVTAGCASNINISSIVPGDTTTSVVLVNDQAVGCQSTFIDSGLTYNAATNVLNTTVTTAQTTNKVKTVEAPSTSSNFHLTFVNSNNSVAADEDLFTSNNISYNNAQNNLSIAGDIRLTNAGNSVIRPIINLIPTGTASFNPNSTNTTTYAEYGINIISSASVQSNCLRLPQIPTQGKTVTLINKSGINVLVFPSVIGGDINGVIDSPFTLLSDGKSYSFDCYENPLPGGWSVTNVVASTTTITSGIINYIHTTSSQFLYFVNDSIKSSGSSTSAANAYNGLNAIPYSTGNFTIPLVPLANFVFGRIYPDTIPNGFPFQSINSIQILTNITASNNFINFKLTLGTAIEFYDPTNNIGPVGYPSFPLSNYNTFAASTLNPWFVNHPGTINSTFYMAIQQPPQTTSVVPGTFIPSTQSPYTSNNVGDPGTKIINIPILPTSVAIGGGFKMLGRNYIGSFIDPYYGQLDAYYNAEFCPVFELNVFNNLFNSVNVPNVKIQASYNVSL